jgi:poly-gamma-glutamate synthesis protein (capsule biosynthesis protein)
MILAGRSREILSAIAPVLSAKDVSVVNLEGPLTGGGRAVKKTGPNLKMDHACADFLDAAQFDVANLANNHIGDFGPRPVLETMTVLRRRRFMYVGAGADLKRAYQPLFFTRKNIRCGILSFAENEFGMAEKNKAGFAPLNPPLNCAQIREAANRTDILLVLVHGGNEYNPIPSPRMVAAYRSFAEAGAAAVIGNHPHCPQGIEMYHGKPIIYSLGNFLFDWSAGTKLPYFWWRSFLAKITFNRSRAVRVETIPYVCKDKGAYLVPLAGKARQDFLRYLQYISDVIKDERELERYWHGWCAMHGANWLEYIRHVPHPLRKDTRSLVRLLLARNAFSCEAHCELLTTFFRMACENRIGAARKYIPAIKKLQQGLIP